MLKTEDHSCTSTEARYIILEEEFCTREDVFFLKILFIAGHLLYVIEILGTDRPTYSRHRHSEKALPSQKTLAMSYSGKQMYILSVHILSRIIYLEFTALGAQFPILISYSGDVCVEKLQVNITDVMKKC